MTCLQSGIPALLFALLLSACARTASARDAAPPVASEDDHTSVRTTALLEAEDIEGLSILAKELRAGRSRNGSGKWNLNIFYEILESGRSGKDPKARGASARFLERWRKRKPDSATPLVAMARLHVKSAWAARGGGFAHTVSDQSFNRFNEELEAAWKVLEEGDRLKERDPELYAVWITAAMGLGKSDEEIEAIFQKGAAVERGYTRLYFERLVTLLPRWGGEPDSPEKFARRAVEMTREDEGDALYTRLAYHAYNYVGVSEFLNDYHFSWPVIKSGFEDLIKAYPRSGRLLNQYLRMAGIHGDKETSLALFQKVGSDWHKSIWPDETTFNAWKSWALEGGLFPGDGGLIQAAETGDLEAARRLLAGGASLTHTDERGWTPLLAAIYGHQYEMVDFLLDQGADPKSPNSRKVTPLAAAVGAGDALLAEKFIGLGADVDPLDSTGWSPLLTAAHGNQLEIVRMLLEHGAEANAGGDPLPTPLTRAARSGNNEMARLLLDHGADPNLAGKDNWTPLLYAAGDLNGELIGMLMDRGVDPNIPTSGGDYPLNRLAAAGRWDLVKLLLDYGADPDCGAPSEWTPLTSAAAKGSPEGVRMLLAKGADINKRGPNGWPPIHFAVARGNDEIAELLLARDDLDITPLLDSKETVLHVAARNSGRSVIESLLKRGADAKAKDRLGMTPTANARLAGRKDIEDLIRNYGKPESPR